MVKLIEIKNRGEWNTYRGTGIGASDVPTILGLNPFKSELQLWHEKLGFKQYSYINLKMLGGLEIEEFISNTFRAYQPSNTVEQTAENIQNKKFFRNCEKLPLHAFVVNPESCENLYVSPDRLILDSSGNGIGSLEIKNTSNMYLRTFTDGVSPAHICQLKTQMFIWEKDHGVLAYLIDGGSAYKEYPFERDGIIFHNKHTGHIITEDDLKDKVQDFWTSVVMGREAMHKMQQAKISFNMMAAQQYQAILDQLEPSPDSSLAYEDFIKETYYSFARPCIETKGTAEDVVIAEDYLRAKEEADNKKKVYQLHKNKILSLCKSGNKIILPGNAAFIEVRDTKAGVKINVKV